LPSRDKATAPEYWIRTSSAHPCRPCSIWRGNPFSPSVSPPQPLHPPEGPGPGAQKRRSSPAGNRQPAPPAHQLRRQDHVHGLPGRRVSTRRLAGAHGHEGPTAAALRRRLGQPGAGRPGAGPAARDGRYTAHHHAKRRPRRFVPPLPCHKPLTLPLPPCGVLARARGRTGTRKGAETKTAQAQ